MASVSRRPDAFTVLVNSLVLYALLVDVECALSFSIRVHCFPQGVSIVEHVSTGINHRAAPPSVN